MSSRFPRAGVALLLLTLSGAIALAAAEIAAGGDRRAKLHFESGGRKIDVDFYLGAGAAPHRTILVMPGAGGTLLDGPNLRRTARQLAAAGDTVYLLHYFDRTGTIVAWTSLMERHFDAWLGTVRDAIAWVRTREGEHPAKIGIYGYSLGAFLALAASSDNPAVGAVVERAGGMWNSRARLIGRMPPVLMIHGLADQRVPFDKYAKPLLRVLQERGARVRTHFVPGEGHEFSQPTMVAVRTELVQYFARELEPGASAGR